MLRLFKWILVTAVSLILILAIALIWLVVGVDPNSYKPQLEKLAGQQGVELQMRGDLSWQFFPDLGFRLADTSARIPAQGVEQLDVRELTLALDKSQLLKRKVEFRSIRIAGADLMVRSVEDAGKVIATPVVAGSAGENTDSASTPIALAINQIEIADSHITVAQADGDLVLNGLNLSISNINLNNQAIALGLSTTIQSGESQPVKLSLKSSLMPNLGNANLTLTDLAGPNADKLLQQLNLQIAATKLDINYGDMPITVELQGNYQQSTQRLALENYQGTLGDMNFSGSLTVDKIIESPSAKGQLEIKPFNVSRLLATLGAEADVPVKTMAFSSTLNASAENILLDNLQITIDQQPLTGRFQLALATPRNLDLSLQGKALTVPPSKDTGVKEEQAAAALLTPLLAPLAVLEGGKGHIELTLNQFKFENYQIGNLHLNLLANGNIVQLSDLSGKIFNGSFKGNARIDLRDKIPGLQFSTVITNMDVQQLTKAAADMEDISGILNMDFSGQGQGDTADAIQQTLRGNGKLLLAQPVVRNINVEQSVCQASELLSNSTSSSFSETTTKFTDINSDLAFNNGIASLKNLTTSTGNLHVIANGDVDTLKKLVNLQLKARIKGDKSSETGCSVNRHLRNVDIPIRCAGPLEGEISCRPDQAFIQNLIQKAVVDEISKRFLKDKSTTTDKNTTQSDPQQTDQTEKPAKKTDAEKVEETLDLLRGLMKK